MARINQFAFEDVGISCEASKLYRLDDRNRVTGLRSQPICSRPQRRHRIKVRDGVAPTASYEIHIGESPQKIKSLIKIPIKVLKVVVFASPDVPCPPLRKVALPSMDIFDNPYLLQSMIDEEVNHTLVDNYPFIGRVPPYNHIDHVYAHPTRSARVTAQDGIQEQSLALQDLQDDSAFDLTGCTNRGLLVEPIANGMGLATSLAAGSPSYQVTKTIFPAPLPSPCGAPYCPDPQAYSQAIQVPSHIDIVQPTTTLPYFMSRVAEPRDIPPSYQVPSPLGELAGDAAVVLSPFSSPTVSTAHGVSVTTPSNAIHICRCSSACNAVLDGNIQAVRNHLKREHQFCSTAKESIQCLWAGCEQKLQRENIPRHIVTRHLHVKVNCPACGTALARRDVQRSHAKVCRARGQISASRLRTGVSSSNARSANFNGTNPFSPKHCPLRGHGVVPMFSAYPRTPFDMATTPGRVSHTLPIQAIANTTGSPGHTLGLPLPTAGNGNRLAFVARA